MAYHTTLCVLLLASLLLQPIPGQALEEGVYVQVLDQDGVPQVGMSLTLANETYSRSAVTNATGWAEFAGIPQGVYEVSAMFEENPVGTLTLAVPEVTRGTITVLLADLVVQPVDMSQKPLADFEIIVMSERGGFERIEKTNDTGVVVFAGLPFSSISSIGTYTVQARTENLVLASVHISVPVSPLKMSVPVLDLNVSVINLEGNTVRNALVHATSKTGNLSLSATTGEGFALFQQLPASQTAGVGTYTLTAEVGGVLVYEETQFVQENMNMTVTASLGRIIVQVTDPDGAPLRKVLVRFSNETNGTFISRQTGSEGKVEIENMPLSETEIGPYRVTLSRGGVVLKSLTLALDKAYHLEKVSLPLMEVNITLEDAAGGRVAPHTRVSLTDSLDPSRTFWVHTDDFGVAHLKVLGGPYNVTVEFDDHVVYTGSLTVDQPELELLGVAVNLPLAIVIEDAVGTPLPGVQVEIDFDGTNLFSGMSDSEGLVEAKVPYPGTVAVKIKENGEHLLTKTVPVTGVVATGLRIPSLVVLLGFRVKTSQLILILTLLAAISVLAPSAYLHRRSLTKRLKGPRESTPPKTRRDESTEST